MSEPRIFLERNGLLRRIRLGNLRCKTALWILLTLFQNEAKKRGCHTIGGHPMCSDELGHQQWIGKNSSNG